MSVKNTRLSSGGAELTVAAMDDVSRTNIGQSTYRFVRRLMQDPEARAKIKTQADRVAGRATS